MVSDYLKQTRSLEELYALFEHEREAIAQSARSSLSIEIAKAKQRILDIDGLADSRICSDVSSATNKITSQSDAHLALVTNAVNNFHSFVQSSGIHERGSSNEDLLSSFARKTQAYIEETSADALAQINEEAHAAINKIDLMAEQSTSEIKSFQKTIEIFRDETAYATAAKIDAEEKAAADGAVLSSLTVSSELKS